MLNSRNKVAGSCISVLRIGPLPISKSTSKHPQCFRMSGDWTAGCPGHRTQGSKTRRLRGTALPLRPGRRSSLRRQVVQGPRGVLPVHAQREAADEALPHPGTGGSSRRCKYRGSFGSTSTTPQIYQSTFTARLGVGLVRFK